MRGYFFERIFLWAGGTSRHRFLSSSLTFGFPDGQVVKSLPAVRETQVQCLGQEDSPGGRNGNPLQYSCLENRMDGGAWQATDRGVTKSRTQLSNLTFFLSLTFVLLGK